MEHLVIVQLNAGLNAKERGFTLVELLIVVAIIAILAAIAIPQFSEYRKRGYAASVNSDIMNAYSMAEAYFTENPGAVLTDCTTIISAGYVPTQGTTCAASSFQVNSGAISISGNPSWSLSVNTATIDYKGALTPAKP